MLFSFLDTSAKYLVLSGMAAPFVVLGALRGPCRAGARPAARLARTRRCSGSPTCRCRCCAALFLFGSTIFNFLALQTLQLAETTSIFFFAPMVITALAGPLLGEWAGWRRWLAILAGFVGVLVITRPGVGVFGIGHVYALCAMLSYCFYVIMTRRMAATETPESLIFYSALAPVDPAAADRAVHGLAAARIPGTG